MSTDRRTGLDTGLTRNSPGWDQGYGSDKKHRNKPAEDDTNAFKRAMSEPAQPMAQPPVTPFGLFGAAAIPLPAPDTAARQLEESVGLAAKRLLVSDQGSSGPRAVRMDLADEFLPDVSVSLYEEGGQLVVAFRCGTEDAQARVSTLAPGLAADLAKSLSRTVRVSLQDKEGADIHPGNWEADAPGTLTLKDGFS